MIGERVKHYRLLRKIGAGGMSEVYAAQDTRLDRQVALKVLPPEMFSDEERRERFEREAKAVAALDHPNIVVLHSIELGAIYPDEKFVHFLTMQLVDGETLDEVIPADGLSLGEVFALAIPLVDAVAAAHARGIAHRDLKPSNVMVDRRGRVKVLDFGLAKLLQPEDADDASRLPTEHVTREGTILGTVAYMSPEQAEGTGIDERSDIFSLGVLLYEMATGRRPFQGDTRMSLITSILRDEPRAVTELKPRLPRHLARIVRRCLAKDPERRYQTAIDLRNELEDLQRELDPGDLEATGSATGAATGAGPVDSGADTGGDRRSSAGDRAPAATSGGASPGEETTDTVRSGRTSGGGATPAGWTVEPREPLPLPGWAVALGITLLGGIVLVVAGSYLTPLSGPDPSSPAGAALSIRPLTSSVEWEWAPTWSPDGTQIAYSHGRAAKADISVKALDGEPHVIVSSRYDDVTPRWSPDGSKIAFISDRGAGATIYWVPPTGGTERRIVETGIPYFERWEASYAMGSQPWSPEGRELVFSRRQPAGEIALWKVDLTTGEERQLTFPDPEIEDFDPAWSPDGQRIAFSRVSAGIGALWILDAGGGEPEILLGGEDHHSGPAWTPDGERIVFASYLSGAQNLWQIDASGGQPRRLTTGSGDDFVPVVSRDGRIAYANFGHQVDLFWLPVESPEEQRRLTSHTHENFGPRVSPDGRHVAYESNRTGNDEIWLLDLDSGKERQITDHPATDRVPDWSPDGERIVFLSNREGPFQLWIVDLQAGGLERLIDQPIPMPVTAWAGIRLGPRWSPDGELIGYIAGDGDGPTLWTVRPDGSNRTRTGLPGVLRFDWYLDSRRVVYSRASPDGSGSSEIYAAHLETGEEELLLSGLNAELMVSPDGDALTFLQAPGHLSMDLYLLPLQLPAGPDGLPRRAGDSSQLTKGELWHAHGGGWAPGGEAIVYTRDLDQGDIYLIENYR